MVSSLSSRNSRLSPTDISTMLEIYDLAWDADDEPGAVVELPPADDSGPALELHVYARREGALAVWLLDDGTPLGEQRVAAC